MTEPEARVGDVLSDREERVALAESLTGGLVGSRVTDVPGSSEYFDRATVAYSNDAKVDALGVRRETLDAHGAVSAEAAEAMARGARDGAGAEWGVSTTGIAGPDGGTPEKPVGLVYVGVAYAAPWGTGASFARAERHLFDGDRRAVKAASADAALSLLERALRDA